MGMKGKGHQLDREAWMLLLLQGLYGLAIALSNTFVSIFLWKLKKNLFLIGWFYLVQYFTVAITFLFAGWICKQVDRTIAIRIGVILQAGFYLLVLFLGNKAGNFVTVLGILFGIGNGFFWMAYNVLYFEITSAENRDRFNGINGFLGSLTGMAAPLLSGWLITRTGELSGYRMIFLLSLIVFFIAIVVSFFLKRRKAKGKYRLFHVLSFAFRKKSAWYWVHRAMLFQGLREGVFSFLTGLFVYFATTSELVLGTFYTISSLISMFSFFVVGRWIQQKWRSRSIFLGTLFMGLVSLPYVFTFKLWAVFVMGFGIFLFYPFYLAPLTSTAFDVIGKNEQSVAHRVEFVVAREIALNAGRILSSSAFLIWVSCFPEMEQLRWFLLLFSFVQMGSWFSIRHILS